MSGGNVVEAEALNNNIAAVIPQVPFLSGDGLSRASRQPPATLIMERGNAVATGKPTMIPTYPELRNGAVHDNPGAVLAGPSAAKFIEEMVRRGYSWAEAATAQSVANCSLSEPLAYIHRISPTSLLTIVADNDTITDTRSQFEAFEKALQPKKLLIMKGEDHFSVYFGEAFEKNVGGQIDFLKETFSI
ncbi:kda in trax-fino intergenic region [Fusarium agapanthi]|uniref:KDa in trax-fino intergenic region n=1 Tax=Fusarium agapanthi TaxID=1803897 RepID=A0A9P5BHI6_9HYPO|nr:kda in trax-fino intergenic region [Fusarium agapanthi]